MTEQEIKDIVANEVQRQLALNRTNDNDSNIEVLEEIQIEGYNQRYRAIVRNGELLFQHQNGTNPFKDIKNGMFEEFKIEFASLARTKSSSSTKYTAENFVFRLKDSLAKTKSAENQDNALKIDEPVQKRLETDRLINIDYQQENDNQNIYTVNILNGLYSVSSLPKGQVYQDSQGYLRIVI